ncbi:uncharacterized protein [Montipora capricornis]|uniref:uncharacterized protein n=1 Tax=Montipora capricornis TaxID=246305 RepID=UPI0035F1BB1E
MSDYDYQELVHITDTIAMKVKAFNQKPTKEQDSPTRPTQAEVLKVLSPGSETTYRTYTPKRKRAFERGLLAGMKSRRSENSTQSTGPSLQEDIATPSVEGPRKEGARARKSLFAPPVDDALDSRQEAPITIPEPVPGTVGVFPRTDVYIKEPGKKKRGKGKTGSSRSKCKTCGQESPSGKKARVY